MTVQPQIRTGFALGTGAAINVELGFVPDYVTVMNATDLDTLSIWIRQRVMAFTSGGTTEIVAGDVLQGATSTGVRCRVRQVVLVSGTFAAGTAAGFFLFTEDDETGTFGSENVDLLDASAKSLRLGGAVATANVATVTAQSELSQVASAAAVAALAPATGLSPYVGAEATNEMGFTIGSTVSESGKLLAWVAMRASNHDG